MNLTMKTLRTPETVKTQHETQPAALPSSEQQTEGGASLLYVVTFCSSVFGSEAGLSHCRTQMIEKVD